jgi:2-C-methyl-D-erythritol 2,4-cyclodiphosphate synthase
VTLPDLRVGSGFDVHAFSADPARPLVLGGVTIAGARGLHGHSDADVIAHACAEALLGASGLGDLGSWFPDTDPTYAGADSIALLRTVSHAVRNGGWSVINIDCSVVCEQPRLAPHRDAMQQRLSDAVGAPVSVKGRRAEGMGALGRREGIACWAVALVGRNEREDR